MTRLTQITSGHLELSLASPAAMLKLCWTMLCVSFCCLGILWCVEQNGLFLGRKVSHDHLSVPSARWAENCCFSPSLLLFDSPENVCSWVSIFSLFSGIFISLFIYLLQTVPLTWERLMPVLDCRKRIFLPFLNGVTAQWGVENPILLKISSKINFLYFLI